MSYIIATWKDGTPFAITACAKANAFKLIPVDSEVALNKIYSNPHRAGALQILKWINENDNELASQELNVQDEARFRK